MYQIERGIPIPKKQTGSYGRTAKYPFRDLEIGDSFFVPISEGRKVRFLGGHTYKNKGKKFVQRKVAGGIRVWRIE